MNPIFNEQQIQNMLRPVAETAWEISSKMMLSRLTFDFRFPDVGGRFSHQSMLSIGQMDAEDAQGKALRVALVVTPVVTFINETGLNTSAHSVSKADVMCMK